MYRVKITTKYNTIDLIVEDINSPILKEIFNQPWVEGVFINSLEQYYEEEKDKLLSHCVGMSYNTNRVLELSHLLKKEK